jgi:hypothetical protein
MFAQRSRQFRNSALRTRRLSAEPLEDRHLLSAGSVTVGAPVAGLLTITGDGNDDSVLVSGSTADAGTFTIKGLHGTKINGVANGSVTDTGVTDIQTALWGDGKDSFKFTDPNTAGLAGGLSVTMGNGNDEVDLGNGDGDNHSGAGNGVTKVGGNVGVTLGNGNDEVEAEKLNVGGNQGFIVSLGNGNDKVDADKVTVTVNGTVIASMVALAAVPTVGNEGFLVSLGNGNDKVEVENVTVTVNGIVPPGGTVAPQIVAASNQGFGVIMGDGNDKVEAENVTVSVSNAVDGTAPVIPVVSNQGFGIMMGNGNDKVEAEKIIVTITGAAAGKQGFGVQLGNGNDKVELEKVTVTGGQGLAVVVGNGRDEVDLGGDDGDWGSHHNSINVTGDVLIQLGTGKDDVDVYGVTTGGNFDVEKTGAGGLGANIELEHVTVGTVASPANLKVNLSGDTGKDELEVSHTRVTGTTTFTGGSGTTDDYDPGNGNSFASPPVVTGFEK